MFFRVLDGQTPEQIVVFKSLKKEVFNFPSKRNTWFHQSFGTMLRSLMTCAKKGGEAILGCFVIINNNRCPTEKKLHLTSDHTLLGKRVTCSKLLWSHGFPPSKTRRTFCVASNLRVPFFLAGIWGQFSVFGDEISRYYYMIIW